MFIKLFIGCVHFAHCAAVIVSNCTAAYNNILYCVRFSNNTLFHVKHLINCCLNDFFINMLFP